MKLFRRTGHAGMSSNWRLCIRSYLCAPKSNPYTVVKSFTIWRANVAENVKFVDDLQQALRESLAVFPVSGEQNLNKNFLSRTLWEGGMFSDSYRRGLERASSFQLLPFSSCSTYLRGPCDKITSRDWQSFIHSKLYEKSRTI